MDEARVMSLPQEEDIYEGTVPVVLKYADRDDKPTVLTVAMSYAIGQPRNQRVLHMQLTDESDAYQLGERIPALSNEALHQLLTQSNQRSSATGELGAKLRDARLRKIHKAGGVLADPSAAHSLCLPPFASILCILQYFVPRRCSEFEF